MMHKYSLFFLLMATAALLSCQKGEENQPSATVEIENTISINMVLNGGIHLWDSPQTKATLEWPDGSILYIQFYNDNGCYPAKATYRSETGKWTLNLDGTAFANTDGGTCECYFFENWNDRNNKAISLGKYTAIYEGWGDYTVSGGTVTLSVTLSPKTGRVKFKCSEGYEYHYARIHGLSYYTKFDLSSFSFEMSENKYLELYVTPDTEYIYCFFTDYNNPTIIGYNNEWSYSSHYERTFDASVLDPGRSVICEWPIDAAHNEWVKYESPIDDLGFGSYAEFCFIGAGSFILGGGSKNASPSHWVNLTRHYYIQRWETGRNLWYYALGKPTGWQSDNKPVTGKTWDEIQEFIFALNVKTGQNYRLPTEAEWEWACRGSWQSQGFDYYGSDTPYSYRGDAIQRPGYGNEIGMADMCGNAGEFVQDWYAPYTASSQTNPKGPATGDYHVIRGGDISSPDEGVSVYARSTEETSLLQYTGFRLAMDVPEMYETYKGAKLFAPSRLPLGKVPVGQTGHAKLTVRASLLEDVTFQIQGSGDGFSYSPSGEIAIPAGGVKEVDFTFSPSQTGEKTASFNVVSSSLATPIKVTVSGTGRSEDEALIILERKYLLLNMNNYAYPRLSICFNNETSIQFGYYNTSYYDGWYHNYEERLNGVFIFPTNGGNLYQNRTEEPWNPANLPEENTWVREKILIYPNSDVDYYVNGTYMGTCSFNTLDLSAVEQFSIQCSPDGSSSGIEHWMDDFSVRTLSGYSYSDDFGSEKLNTSFWKVPANPAGVKQEDGVLKTSLRRTGDDYTLLSRNIDL